MWPFKRREKTEQTETQYYQGQQRERVGVAWLLAALTLVATVLIVLLVFFAGRWLYRKITHKDSSTETTQTTQTAQESSGSQATQSESNSSGSSSGGSSTGSNSGSSSSSSQQGTVNAPTQTNNPSSVSSQPTQTSAPNTGPGDTLAIFAVVSLAGYLGYSEYLRRKAVN